MSKTSELEDLLVELQCATVGELLKRVKDGSASAQELNVARQMLKDNDITLGMLDQESPLTALLNDMPDFDPEEAPYH